MNTLSPSVEQLTSLLQNLQPYSNERENVVRLPFEIILEIGKRCNKETLLAFTKSCRAFRDILAPVLYKYCERQLDYAGNQNWAFELTASNASFIHHLTLYMDYTEDWDKDLRSKGEDQLCTFPQIAGTLGQMSQLRSATLNCKGLSPPHQKADVLSALANHASLKHLSISFLDFWSLQSWAEDIGIDSPEFSLKFAFGPQIQSFKNLTTLELYNIPILDSSGICSAIALATTLVQCPGLQTLGLSALEEFDADDIGTHEPVEICYLECLSNEYARLGGKPLHIRKLRLGDSMNGLEESYHGEDGAQEEETQDDGSHSHFLLKLVNLKSLEILHVRNGYGNVKGFDADSDDEDSSDATSSEEPSGDTNEEIDGHPEDEESHVHELGFSVFTQARCPSLRQLSITFGPFTPLNPLRQLKTIRELIVTHDIDFPYERDTDYKVNLSFLYAPKVLSIVPDPAYAETIFERLERPDINLKYFMTTLDFSVEWRVFCLELRKLEALTHLRLGASRQYTPGQIERRSKLPLPPSSPREHQNQEEMKSDLSQEEIAHEYATRAAHICPSLQMVMIKKYCWRITRSTSELGKQSRNRTSRAKNAVRLGKMQNYELNEVELFAIQAHDRDGGLPRFGN